MIRITTHKDSELTSFIVEGKLAGPCVCELEKCWRSSLALEASAHILVDLTNVTFIDAAGKELLARMFVEGTSFEAALLMPKSIIEEIKKTNIRSKQVEGNGNRDSCQSD